MEKMSNSPLSSSCVPKESSRWRLRLIIYRENPDSVTHQIDKENDYPAHGQQPGGYPQTAKKLLDAIPGG